MADDAENHTLRLLQEMRGEMREMRTQMTEMRDDLTTRINGVTIMLGTVLGTLHEHDERITELEGGGGDT